MYTKTYTQIRFGVKCNVECGKHAGESKLGMHQVYETNSPAFLSLQQINYPFSRMREGHTTRQLGNVSLCVYSKIMIFPYIASF